MPSKTALLLISILVVFNCTPFLSGKQPSQNSDLEKQIDRLVTSDIPTGLWKNWVDQTTETIVGTVLEEWEKRDLITQIDDVLFTNIHTSVREQFTAQTVEIKKRYPSPYDMKEYKIEVTIENTGPEKHFGPQTVETIMESFHEEYSHGTKYLYGEASLKELDAQYPPAEWIQMLLDKRVPIENTDDYSQYLSSRRRLVYLEDKPEEWQSGKQGISPTDDFDTYKVAFVNRMIWEHQQMQTELLANPDLMGGFFGGPQAQTFFPYKKGRVYVKRDGKKIVFLGEKLTPKQQFALLSEGAIPEKHEITYLDENLIRLSEPLPPISRETLLEAGIPGPPWNDATLKDNEPEEPDTHVPAGELFRVHVQHPDRLIMPISPRYTSHIHYGSIVQAQESKPMFDVPQDNR